MRDRYGNRLGGAIAALTSDPQSTRAWAQGAQGERAVAGALAAVPGVRVLSDLRVPGTRGNIDHLVVAPAGVFVVDAKRLHGRIEVRDVGHLFSRDLRLYVGRRDRTRLVDGLAWQVRAVSVVLESVGPVEHIQVTPVLCFVDGDWPLLRPPESFRGVRLEGPHSIRRLITRTQVLDGAAIDQLASVLGKAFPPKR